MLIYLLRLDDALSFHVTEQRIFGREGEKKALKSAYTDLVVKNKLLVLDGFIRSAFFYKKYILRLG